MTRAIRSPVGITLSRSAIAIRRIVAGGRLAGLALAGLALAAGSAAAAGSPGPSPAAVYGDAGPVLRLATGSPGELGLVERLAASFSQHTPLKLQWFKAGSGASLRMLREGQVDLVMVHAPAAEAAAVEAGWAAMRTAIGGNVYYLVGPREDPAGVREAADVIDALTRIAGTRARFLSRGDQSGTHRRELALWAEAGIGPDWSG